MIAKKLSDNIGKIIQTLECFICCTIKPLITLPCEHVICVDCANKIFETHRKNNISSGIKHKPKFKCPNCQSECSWSTRANNTALQKNLAGEILVEYFQNETLCRQHDHLCMPLDIKCLDCSVDICGLCYFENHISHSCIAIRESQETYQYQPKVIFFEETVDNDKIQILNETTPIVNNFESCSPVILGDEEEKCVTTYNFPTQELADSHLIVKIKSSDQLSNNDLKFYDNSNMKSNDCLKNNDMINSNHEEYDDKLNYNITNNKNSDQLSNNNLKFYDDLNNSNMKSNDCLENNDMINSNHEEHDDKLNYNINNNENSDQLSNNDLKFYDISNMKSNDCLENNDMLNSNHEEYDDKLNYKSRNRKRTIIFDDDDDDDDDQIESSNSSSNGIDVVEKVDNRQNEYILKAESDQAIVSDVSNQELTIVKEMTKTSSISDQIQNLESSFNQTSDNDWRKRGRGQSAQLPVLDPALWYPTPSNIEKVEIINKETVDDLRKSKSKTRPDKLDDDLCNSKNNTETVRIAKKEKLIIEQNERKDRPRFEKFNPQSHQIDNDLVSHTSKESISNASNYGKYRLNKEQLESLSIDSNDHTIEKRFLGDTTTSCSSVFSEAECSICYSGEVEEDDPIVFCDGCDVAVHLGFTHLLHIYLINIYSHLFITKINKISHSNFILFLSLLPKRLLWSFRGSCAYMVCFDLFYKLFIIIS